MELSSANKEIKILVVPVSKSSDLLLLISKLFYARCIVIYGFQVVLESRSCEENMIAHYNFDSAVYSHYLRWLLKETQVYFGDSSRVEL